MQAARALRQAVGTRNACAALGLSPATFYRQLRPPVERTAAPRRPPPPRALSPTEEQSVLAHLHSDRFVDKAPAEVYATLLDEGTYLCSIRTYYRILTRHQEVRERRNQLRHPVYKKPELLATSPNQVWSWDITRFLGPVKWTYYYLYVIIDIYSRYAVGWMLAHRECAQLAKRLIRETVVKEKVDPGRLVLHSDRGSPMTAKTTAQLMATLGVTRSLSRPKVSNDNPYSESQFKTLKYWPGFPDRFGSIEDGLAFCHDFFLWYNGEHRHGGLGLLTPEHVHRGHAPRILEARALTLQAAYEAHPERFVRRPPQPLQLPPAVWINPPGATGADPGLH